MEKNKTILIITILIISILVIYTILDNNRIKIVEQEVRIDNLPDELKGFTILQVTDLHEKEFGQNQVRLIEKINSISFDVIVFTGDMLVNSESTNYKPFFTLLEGIDNKDEALFVPGNSDPDIYSLNKDTLYKETDLISGMEKRGVKLLESLHTIRKGSTKVHFIDFEFSIQDKDSAIKSIEDTLETENSSTKYLNHQKQLFDEFSSLDHKFDSDVLIGLTHFPIVDERLDYLISNSNFIIRDYDLVIAGHYHGGQIRLPFLGAIFIPEGWYPRKGLLPPQDRVKGLWGYKDIKQYVSTGLGSSEALPLLKFRLFNTPEINLLTLRDAK
ncbi:metallophosphoesterase [Neobacillus sp. LXY-4]|uniref:metallophosphoesterase n=1 Tax=Neobacillus sp. LXY-4 TaxID=3379826 RepID=UPI003EE3A0CE